MTILTRPSRPRPTARPGRTHLVGGGEKLGWGGGSTCKKTACRGGPTCRKLGLHANMQSYVQTCITDAQRAMQQGIIDTSIQVLLTYSCTIYGHIWTYMAIHGHIWPYMAIYRNICPYMAIYGNIWPYIVIYSHKCPYMAIYGHIWSYMAMYGPYE